jgi:hypothetical protein
VLAFTGMRIFYKKFVEIVDKISYDRFQPRDRYPRLYLSHRALH